MARPMKMKDKKNYMKRLHSNQSGNYTGAESTDKSKYLAIIYDRDHGIPLTEEKRLFIEKYEKETMIQRL